MVAIATLSVWLDIENGIPLGSAFDVKIEDGIRSSQLLIAVLSPHSFRNDTFCRNELLFAQARRLPILPIRIADVVPPIQIISLNYVDAIHDVEKAFQDLLLGIEATLGRGKMRLNQPDGNDNSWWESLRSLEFEEELAKHGGSFTGREWLFKTSRALD